MNRDVNNEYASSSIKFEKFDQKVKANLENGKAVNLWAFKDLGIRLSTYSIMKNDTATALKGLVSFLEAGIAHLKQEYSDLPVLNINLGSDEFQIESSIKKKETSLFDWWNIFNSAMILHNDQSKNELFELLDRCANDTQDPFWRRSMDLISMCQEKKEFEDSILNDLKKIVNSSIVMHHGLDCKKLIKSEESKNLRIKMWLPIMELYYLAFQKDEKKFNMILEEFLLNKKDWILKNKEEDNSNYWVDFPLLACCSYAYDRKITISIESDYIPSFVYQRFSKDESI